MGQTKQSARAWHVHMKAIAAPLNWSDIPEHAHPLFKALRSPAGERMVLEDNVFVENILPQAVIRQLSDEEFNITARLSATRARTAAQCYRGPRSLPD